MTKNEVVEFIRENPYTYVTHPSFESYAYIYADFNGFIWDENGYPYNIKGCKLENDWKIYEK